MDKNNKKISDIKMETKFNRNYKTQTVKKKNEIASFR